MCNTYNTVHQTSEGVISVAISYKNNKCYFFCFFIKYRNKSDSAQPLNLG